jgi:hypothetical protein
VRAGLAVCTVLVGLGVWGEAVALPPPVTKAPPGSDDTGPSGVIFPEQQLPLRFDHRKHATAPLGLSCTSCHPGAGLAANAPMLPRGATCDACHGSKHDGVVSGACAFCHVGVEQGRVRPVRIPRGNLVFSHRKHAVRNIACPHCHGDVTAVGLATREQLPRMRGCLVCHGRPDAASRGDAHSACETCHLRNVGEEGGLIRTVYREGVLYPPRWLGDASHTADFVERHKAVAGLDSALCANCHVERFCTDCHDGRVRPRRVHPNDYVSMHPVEARTMATRCGSCHREQTFCLGCHQRLGVTRTGPPSARGGGRFHPSKAIWSDAPRKPGHHAMEATRNLEACVGCHIERDCVVCHGALGIGAGRSPHPSGFASSCASAMRRNPRPCFVCHAPGAEVLGRCL